MIEFIGFTLKTIFFFSNTLEFIMMIKKINVSCCLRSFEEIFKVKKIYN